MNILQGKNILITGGSKGIGQSIALELAKKGANLFLFARGEKDLQESTKLINSSISTCKVITFCGDVCNLLDVNNAVAKMIAEFGVIDGLINNAGISKPGYFQEQPFEDFEHAMRVNYLGAVAFTQATLPSIPSGGFIAFTSSVLGFMGLFGYTSYSSTKFALHGFAESLRQELLIQKISVHLLCPPDTYTPGYASENLTKPFETVVLAEKAKILSSETVARIFTRGLLKKRFMIICTFETKLYNLIQRLSPNLAHFITSRIIRGAQKRKTL